LILVERAHHDVRQRFTTAHELGHVLLPWHVGSSFVCEPGLYAFPSDEDAIAAWQAADAERQANSFAASLLLPTDWVLGRITEHGIDPIKPLLRCLSEARVSAFVACIRLQPLLPAGHVFIIVEPLDRVALSGQSPGTGIYPPRRGDRIERDRLDRFATNHEEIRFGGRTILWWHFLGKPPAGVEPSEDDTASQILAVLLARHTDDETAAGKIRSSLAGVIGAANSVARRAGDTQRDSLYVRFRSRFAKERDLPEQFLTDPDFDRWLRLRATELAE
jgi:hypothetical protein